jgi:hypothetical protein
VRERERERAPYTNHKLARSGDRECLHQLSLGGTERVAFTHPQLEQQIVVRVILHHKPRVQQELLVGPGACGVMRSGAEVVRYDVSSCKVRKLGFSSHHLDEGRRERERERERESRITSTKQGGKRESARARDREHRTVEHKHLRVRVRVRVSAP